jgi:beta-glucosidase
VTADRRSITGDERITFTVDVTNTGRTAGAETVQLYISDKQSSVERPVKELKGFRKVYLHPGETQSVSITVGRDALSFYDEASGSWKAEPGDFEALIGCSAADIRSRCPFTLLP